VETSERLFSKLNMRPVNAILYRQADAIVAESGRKVNPADSMKW